MDALTRDEEGRCSDSICVHICVHKYPIGSRSGTMMSLPQPTLIKHLRRRMHHNSKSQTLLSACRTRSSLFSSKSSHVNRKTDSTEYSNLQTVSLFQTEPPHLCIYVSFPHKGNLIESFACSPLASFLPSKKFALTINYLITQHQCKTVASCFWIHSQSNFRQQWATALPISKILSPT